MWAKLIYAIHFSDNIPDVLVDCVNNTITLDTNWVAPDHGTAGQFAVSDGAGGITWETLYEAEEASF